MSSSTEPRIPRIPGALVLIMFNMFISNLNPLFASEIYSQNIINAYENVAEICALLDGLAIPKTGGVRRVKPEDTTVILSASSADPAHYIEQCRSLVVQSIHFHIWTLSRQFGVVRNERVNVWLQAVVQALERARVLVLAEELLSPEKISVPQPAKAKDEYRDPAKSSRRSDQDATTDEKISQIITQTGSKNGSTATTRPNLKTNKGAAKSSKSSKINKSTRSKKRLPTAVNSALGLKYRASKPNATPDPPADKDE